MAASTGDKITDTRNAARPNSARVTSGRAAAGVTLACDNLAGWPTASKVHFVTYTVDSSSNPVAGTQLDCYGIVSGNSLTSFTVVDGTDTGNSIGDYVEMLPTAAWGQDLSDALTSTHNRSGGLKSGITLTQPAIADFTNADHTHATAAQGGQLTGAAITPGSQLADRLLNPYKFSVYRSAAVNSINAATLIQFDTKTFDTGSNVDIVTNKGRFTAPIAGFYYFSAAAGNSVNVVGAQFVYLYKNGSQVKQGGVNTNATSMDIGATVSGLLQLAANDYVEAYFIGGNGSAMGVGAQFCYFEGFLVSAT